MIPKTKPFLTAKEAAELTGYNLTIFRRFLHAGKIKAYKPGRHYLITPEDLEAWVNDHCNQK